MQKGELDNIDGGEEAKAGQGHAVIFDVHVLSHPAIIDSRAMFL